jgi:hypothetical protein
MNFGRYYIGQDFFEIAENATVVSHANKAVTLLTFDDEIEYHVNDAIFCLTPWATFVGVTQGKVFRISLQTSDKQLEYPLTGNVFSDMLFKQFNDKLSSFVFQQRVDNFSITVWDTTWGNVTLIKSNLNKKKSDLLDEYTVTVTGGPSRVKEGKKEIDPFNELLIGLNNASSS